MSDTRAGYAYAELVRSMKQEFPSFQIVRKSESRLMKFINFILCFITFGLQCTFMTHYISTVGYTVYVPDRWYSNNDIARMIVLRHERVHMRQRRAFTLPFYAFLYLLFPLPCGLAYFRTLFEMEAYEETIRATVELYPNGVDLVRMDRAKQQMVENFTGPGYFWMWPFKKRVEAWYDVAVSRALVNQPAE